MPDVKIEPDLFQVTPPLEAAYVSKETASFHLQHMVGSVLEQRGFSSCQAGVLVELERMLQDHIANMYNQAHLLAEHSSRVQPTPIDMLESLSTSYLSRVDPHLFTMTTTPPPSPVLEGYETSDQRETRIQRAQWRERDELEKKVHETVLESYEAPIREFKRVMDRDRRMAKKEDSRTLVPLPLSTHSLPAPPEDPYAISLSDTEESPGPSTRRSTSAREGTDGTPSTPLPQKRRRTSTIHRLDALSETLTTPRLAVPGQGQGQGQGHVKAEPLDEPGPSTALGSKAEERGGSNAAGEGKREIRVRENVKPGYMGDVPWVPGLPSRHRWRKTYERQAPTDVSQTTASRGKQLSTKTLEYLTSSVQSGSSSLSTLNLLSDKREKAGNAVSGGRHTVPLELAKVNYHASRSSFPVSAGHGPTASASTSGPGGLAGTGMMDTPLAQGAGFSSGDEVFEQILRGAAGGGRGMKRKRWIVGVERELSRVEQVG